MAAFINISVSAQDIGGNLYDDGDLLAEVLNEIGYRLTDQPENKFRDRVLRDFASGLDEQGEAALRQLVARLDAIDATSTEGR